MKQESRLHAADDMARSAADQGGHPLNSNQSAKRDLQETSRQKQTQKEQMQPQKMSQKLKLRER